MKAKESEDLFSNFFQNFRKKMEKENKSWCPRCEFWAPKEEHECFKRSISKK